MHICVTKRKSVKVIVDKLFITDKNKRTNNLILQFQTKDKNGHTKNKYVR